MIDQYNWSREDKFLSIFLDEEGSFGKGSNNWIILNTRETVHKQEPFNSKNPIIVLRYLMLKKQFLKKDFPWNKLEFNKKNRTIKMIGCSIKSRDQEIIKSAQNGIMTFEEVMKASILEFTKKTNFQIMFVFENKWIRRINFENSEITSSRLTLYNAKQTKNPECIIADEPFIHEFEGAISSKEFGEKIGIPGETLKEIALNIDFTKQKNIFIPLPSPDFSFTLNSFPGRKRLWKQRWILAVGLCLYIYFSLLEYLISTANEEKKLAIEDLQKKIYGDQNLKLKKEFLSVFLKKSWNSHKSSVKKIEALKELTSQGFYAQMIAGSKEPKLQLTLKPNELTSPQEVLQKFASLENNLKKSLKNATIKVIKPPYGVEKSKGEMRKKSSVTSKIEIIWDKK